MDKSLNNFSGKSEVLNVKSEGKMNFFSDAKFAFVKYESKNEVFNYLCIRLSLFPGSKFSALDFCTEF